nr:reverse transcriptase domain-containing protein [Tanacetum cinerariifolium]
SKVAGEASDPLDVDSDPDIHDMFLSPFRIGNDIDHVSLAFLTIGNRYRMSPTNSVEGTRFLVVAIEYFTKSVEAKPLISTTGTHMEKFVWEHIVCRFGRPQIIISDNGKQFVEGTFPVFCKKLRALQTFTFVYHPQANGQVEVTNREIVKDKERRQRMAHQAWVDELPQVLWAHRTTPKSSNGETPFSLVYRSESIISIEISVETKRVQDFDSKENEKRHREDLDVLEERRKMAAIKKAHYKKIEGYYNKNVKPFTFKPVTYVLRLNYASKAEYQRKMGPMWEGPYRVRKAYRDGAYKLETLYGEAIDRTRNGTNLRKFYV